MKITVIVWDNDNGISLELAKSRPAAVQKVYETIKADWKDDVPIEEYDPEDAIETYLENDQDSRRIQIEEIDIPDALQLSNRELFTVLAALRFWQAEGHQAEVDYWQIAANGGEVEPLNTNEIIGLCERFSLQEKQ